MRYWCKLKLKCIKTEGQSFADRFQGRFFEAPQTKKCGDTLLRNHASLVCGKVLAGKFRNLDVLVACLYIHSDSM